MATPFPSTQRHALGRALSNLTQQDARQVHWQAELKGEDWTAVQSTVTRLFQLRKLPDLAAELPAVSERLSKLSNSDIGQFIAELYQEHLLKKCMIILRQEIREERGEILLNKLGHIWTQFYTSILPTLQAFFAPIPLKGVSIRTLTLVSFRDVVLLKTAISEAIDTCKEFPPEIKQMMLVLQSVGKTPQTDQYLQLQDLVARVVQPYLCMSLPLDQSQYKTSAKRRYSFGETQHSATDTRSRTITTHNEVEQEQLERSTSAPKR